MAYANSLSPFAALAIGSAVATLFALIVILIQGDLKKNIQKSKQVAGDIFLAIFIIAIVVFGITFIALDYTTAQNATLLQQLEVLTGFLVLGVFLKKEPLSSKHVFGAALLVLSAIILLFGGHTAINIGDGLILIAVLVAPIGNMHTKRALYRVSITYLVLLRSLTAAIFFWICSFLFEKEMSFKIFINSLPYLLFSGLVFLGIMRMAMYYGYKNTSVTHTVAMSSLKPICTFLFAWVLLNQEPTIIQLTALIIGIAGFYVLTTAKQKPVQYS